MIPEGWEPYRPSNGCEGEIFMEGQCSRCKKLEDCPTLEAAFTFPLSDPNFLREKWIRREDDREWPGSAKCVEFEEKEPKP